MEIRNFTSAVKTDGKKIVGTAIPYNSLSRNLGGFKERFMPGSVDSAIKSGELQAVWNHDKAHTLGTQRGGTLRFADTPQGMTVEIDLPDTSYARDAKALIERGDGTGMSFGFGCKCFMPGMDSQCRWLKEDGVSVHEVQRVGGMDEVSVLTGRPPAYSATSIALRSADIAGEIDYQERYGVDIETLASVFLSIKRGLPLTKVELEIMNQARSLFLKVRKPLLEAAEMKAASLLID